MDTFLSRSLLQYGYPSFEHLLKSLVPNQFNGVHIEVVVEEFGTSGRVQDLQYSIKIRHGGLEEERGMEFEGFPFGLKLQRGIKEPKIWCELEWWMVLYRTVCGWLGGDMRCIGFGRLVDSEVATTGRLDEDDGAVVLYNVLIKYHNSLVGSRCVIFHGFDKLSWISIPHIDRLVKRTRSYPLSIWWRIINLESVIVILNNVHNDCVSWRCGCTVQNHNPKV